MKRQILVLDDEPDMLKLLERIISEKTPYSITTLGNPLEVPALLERNCFDVIITDLKMPGLDGLDILRLVKDKALDIEVVIMTAFGSLDTAMEALSAGVFDYITNPFKKEQIIFAIDRAMRLQALKRESKQMLHLMDLTPYPQALAAFQREYILRLAARTGAATTELARISGLTRETIAEALQTEGGGHRPDQP